MKAASLLLMLTMLLCIFSGCQKAGKPYTHTPDFELTSEAAFLVDMNTGDIVFEKNADQLMFPSALTQMLTAVVALEETQDVNQEITIPEDFVAEQNGDGSPLSGAAPGEVYTMQDLLNCVIMGTDNNAATLIAQTAGGGDINNFISRLNERAKELGTKSTNFVNPTGVHDTHNYTTARDVAAFASAAAKNASYLEIAQKTDYMITGRANQDARAVTNNDRILAGTDGFPAGIVGLKYSASEQNGLNLVCTLEQNGLRLMTVLMGAPYSADGSAVYDDAKKLLAWASATCVLATPPEKDGPIVSVAVSGDFNAKELALRPEKKLEDLLPKGASLPDIQLLCRIPASISEPVRKGDVLGSADIIYNQQKVSSVNLLAAASVKVGGKSDIVVNILITTGIVLLSLFVLLLIIRQINLIRYRKKRKRALEQRRKQMRRDLEQNASPRPPMRR